MTTRSTKKPHVLDQMPNEADRTYAVRLLTAATADAATRLESLTRSIDDATSLSAFDSSVDLAWFVGSSLSIRATVTVGHKVTVKEALASVNVTERTGTYMARGYKALRECWLIATHDNPTHRASFVAAWRRLTVTADYPNGRAPTQVRQYAAWCRDASSDKVKTQERATLPTLAKRQTAADKLRADAVKRASERSTLVAGVKLAADKVTAPTGKPVAGVALTLAQFASMSADTCEALSIYAASLAKDKREALKAAKETADKNRAAGETGTKVTPRKRGAKAVA